MKDKTIAAVLAFVGGIFGLHRFYLGQTGLGIFYLVFFWISWVLGIIDAIVLLTMDQKKFDLKYNPGAFTYSTSDTFASSSDRQRRFQERERQRAARSRPARAFQPEPKASKTPTSSAEREAGIKYFKDYEFDRAILAFNKALEKNPRDVASHFNVACAYSAEEDADKAFYHLDRAINLGFQDVDRIKTHDSLAFLRVHPKFPAFAANGFRLVADLRKEEEELRLKPEGELLPPPSPDGDLLDQLQRLAALREKGLLTDMEFAAQKRRLLG